MATLVAREATRDARGRDMGDEAGEGAGDSSPRP